MKKLNNSKAHHSINKKLTFVDQKYIAQEYFMLLIFHMIIDLYLFI